MTKEPIKPATKPEPQANADIDGDGEELFEDSEFGVLPENLDKETIRRDARRKIEIYWEKKRLKEQFEDIDESEFDF